MENKDFAVYLARASNLSQRYRDEATTKPSQAIDSLILTAARRAPVSIAIVEPKSWFKRWRIPLSIAAVMVLSVGVTLRTVMQEAKLSSPSSAAPTQQDDAPVPAVKPVESSAATQSAGGAVSPPGSDMSQPKDDLAKKKEMGAETVEEIVIDEPLAPAVRAPPPVTPQDEARSAMPLPAPSNSADARLGALGDKAGSRSSSNELGKLKSAPDPEQDASAAESQSEPRQRNDESALERREPALPDAAENARRGAPAAAQPEAPQAFSNDAPRLPEGHRPIVDGKTYRAEKAQPDREAVEKKQGISATASVDKTEDSPEAWLRRVAELRRLGRNDEANAELERFRKRYPDYPAPVDR